MGNDILIMPYSKNGKTFFYKSHKRHSNHIKLIQVNQFTALKQQHILIFASANQNRYCHRGKEVSNLVLMQFMRKCAFFVRHMRYYVGQHCERLSNLHCLFLALVVFSHNALLIGRSVKGVSSSQAALHSMRFRIKCSQPLSVNNAEYNCIIKYHRDIIQQEIKVISIQLKTFYSTLLSNGNSLNFCSTYCSLRHSETGTKKMCTHMFGLNTQIFIQMTDSLQLIIIVTTTVIMMMMMIIKDTFTSSRVKLSALYKIRRQPTNKSQLHFKNLFFLLSDVQFNEFLSNP